MASKQEIEKELKIALKEIGPITPWFDKAVNEWIFSSLLYPSVEYGGETKEEVIKNYALYLKDFIIERLKSNIEPQVEKTTKGRGGYKVGAGRPKGTTKEPTTRLSLPRDIAEWLKDKSHLTQVRNLMMKGKVTHA